MSVSSLTSGSQYFDLLQIDGGPQSDQQTQRAADPTQQSSQGGGGPTALGAPGPDTPAPSSQAIGRLFSLDA